MLRRCIWQSWRHKRVVYQFPATVENLVRFPTRGTQPTLTCLPWKCAAIKNLSLHTTAVSFKKKKRDPVSYTPKAKTPVVKVWKNMTVQELADAIEKPIDILYEIFLYVKDSDPYDRPSTPIGNLKVIQDAVKKAGFRCKIESAPDKKVVKERENRDATRRPPAPADQLVRRPPVVTIMGHVDHGKTTLLDALRHSSVVDTEFGGITQHIGSFSVQLESGEEVTFLDTPGHAAFSAMRARGAMATDLVVLVVAADDGVMHQTRESIEHAREANVPIIVAINKIDMPDADIPRTHRMLLDCGLQLEEDGGDVQSVEVSALLGQNLTQLVEALVTQAELLDLRADPNGLVEGVVVESRTDTGRGKVATCIIQRGTLRKGAVLVAGTAWAKVRNMFNDVGQPVTAAPPATPVQVIGWRDLPSAGDTVLEVESDKRAKEVLDWRQYEADKERQKEDAVAIQMKLEEHLKVYQAEREERRSLGFRYKRRNLGPRQKEIVDENTGPRLSVILKGDVDGSVEAILDVLDTYHSDDCELNIVSYGVGNVTPGDIDLADAFSGSIYTFNTGVPNDVRKLAVSRGVLIKENNIIYRLIDDLKEEISSKLPSKDVEEVIGEANVLQEFIVTERRNKIPVAGCRCVKGTLKKDAQFRVVRGLDTIHEGPLSSMRHLKSEVNTISRDKECGLMFEDEDIHFEPGDSIICYQIKKVEQFTDWDPGF